MTAIPLLAENPVVFPNPAHALTDPDGLLAAGGALNIAWLLKAYSNGIFPWYEDDETAILWWSPSIRAVLVPGEMRVTKSLKKRIKHAGFELTIDHAFSDVVTACSKPRATGPGTWITPMMHDAYLQLYDAGYAHSVEVWQDEVLCGGLYGVSVGGVFCGESMFSLVPDASKVAFYLLQKRLAAWQFTLIDCQIMNPHLASLGVKEMPREVFLGILADNQQSAAPSDCWRMMKAQAVFG